MTSFQTVDAFFAMGGFAAYVWSAYGITAAVLLWLISATLYEYKKIVPRNIPRKNKTNENEVCIQFAKND